MKKKMVVTILGLMMAASVAGCGAKKDSDGASTEAVKPTESVAASSTAGSSEENYTFTASSLAADAQDETSKSILEAPVVDMDPVDLDKCIQLGDYKSLELTKTVTEVTDEQVTARMEQALTPEAVTDESATAQNGDTVDIAFVGKKDGKEFDGGSSDSYDLELGSHSFIDGFEEGVVGMKKGETKDLNLKFPDDYGSTDLAGQDVVFTVTVNAIKRKPEMNDAWAEKQSGGAQKTLEAYKAEVRSQMEAENDRSADYTLQSDAWSDTEMTCTFLQLPQSYVDEGIQTFEEQLKAQMDQFGMSVDDYLKQSNMSKRDFARRKQQYGRYTAANRLMLEALCKAEQIDEHSDAYKDKLAEIAEESGMSSDDLVQQMGEDTVKQYVLTQLASAKVVSYAKVTTVTSTDSSGAAESTSAKS